MIDSDKEIGALVKRYEENRRHVAAIKARLANDGEALRYLGDALENNVEGIRLVGGHIVLNQGHQVIRKEIPISQLDLNAVLEHVNEYVSAMKCREVMQTHLRDAGLQGLFSK